MEYQIVFLVLIVYNYTVVVINVYFAQVRSLIVLLVQQTESILLIVCNIFILIFRCNTGYYDTGDGTTSSCALCEV